MYSPVYLFHGVVQSQKKKHDILVTATLGRPKKEETLID